MRHRGSLVSTFVIVALALASRAGAGQTPPAPPDISATVSQLGSFDFATRTEAARLVRRTSTAVAVPALEAGVRTHRDEYVRFRAMVMLAGFSDAVAARVMRDMMGDRNDRLRTVAYQWFEHHPDDAVLPALIASLSRETSEFVRPSLTRAIAAQGADPRARAALLPLVMRGEDLFRGALIEALGDYDARYALPAVTDVAQREGPLQDDAITAMGKIGDVSALTALTALRRVVPPEVVPTVSAAFCLLGRDCAAHEAYLRKTLTLAVADAGEAALLRGVVHALSTLAIDGRGWALGALLTAGVSAREPARESIALGVGLVALRNPDLLLSTVAARPRPNPDVELVLEAFDMLSEDFEEERFYIAIRQAYWTAPPESPQRRAAGILIEKLEF